MLTKGYSIIAGVVLILIGLDVWLPTGPGLVVQQTTGIVVLIVGVVGIVVGLMKTGEGKAAAPPTQPTPPSA